METALKLAVEENPVNHVVVSVYDSHLDGLFRSLSVLASSSSQWYAWGPSQMHCKLCSNCWNYWKKYGGLKSPSRIGRLSSNL